MNGLRALATLLRGVLLASLAGGLGSPAHADSDEADWRIAVADGTVRGYQRYLQRNPLGRFAGEAFAAVSRASAGAEWGVPVDGTGSTRSAAAPAAAGATAVSAAGGAALY